MNFRPLQDTQQVLTNLQDEMNRVFDRVWHVGVSTPPLDGQKWAPPIDMYEFDDRYVLVAEVPGVDAADIELSQLGESLTIRGAKKRPAVASDAINTLRTECRHGSFSRTIELPPGAAKDRTNARCAAGMLEVTVYKLETNKPRTIKVQGEACVP